MDAGVGGTSFEWNFVLHGVARFTQACAYDHPGQGYSRESRKPLTSARSWKLGITLAADPDREGQIVVSDAPHPIRRDKPQAVVDGIRATIDAVRRHAGTPCDAAGVRS